ncbi:hypothetical protein [Cellulomonas telluris]|uniref:hypothetical protein n=1 Tax=Cellulomonas telluris TaxID=2306636 RepID=UPI0010A88F7A|nr:hypothetical protein [Cellulomonas telluris]
MTIFGPDLDRPEGLTYAVVLTRADRDAVVAVLTTERFSGWVGPAEDGWVVAVPESPLGHVAARRQHVEELGGTLAAAVAGPVVTVVVTRDELLELWAWDGPRVVLEYVSDPAKADPEDETAMWSGPRGVHQAPALAALSGRPDAAEDVGELLGEELGESEQESERLMAVARLLGWPEWLVAVDSLPRRVPGGPDAGAFVRLRVGRTGPVGVLAARAARVVRRDA